MTGYRFDLHTNELHATFADNPTDGRAHRFIAYGKRSDRDPVTLRNSKS